MCGRNVDVDGARSTHSESRNPLAVGVLDFDGIFKYFVAREEQKNELLANSKVFALININNKGTI